MNTPPNPLTVLAERVELLTGPCRETDALIAATLRITHGAHPWLAKWAGEIRATGHCVQAFNDKGESCANWIPLEFTASLDAAMTLARTPQEAYQAVADAISAIAKRDDLHCCFYRGSLTDDLARQVSAILIRARAASESPHG